MVTAKSIHWIIRCHSVVIGSEVEPRLSILSQFIYLVRGSIRKATTSLEAFPKVFSVPSWTSCLHLLKSVPSAHASLSRKGYSPAFSGDIIFLLKMNQGWVSFPLSTSFHPVMYKHTPLPPWAPYTDRDGKGKLCPSHLFRRWNHLLNISFSTLLVCEEHWHTSHSSQLFHRSSPRSPSYNQVFSTFQCTPEAPFFFPCPLCLLNSYYSQKCWGIMRLKNVPASWSLPVSSLSHVNLLDMMKMRHM